MYRSGGRNGRRIFILHYIIMTCSTIYTLLVRVVIHGDFPTPFPPPPKKKKNPHPRSEGKGGSCPLS